MILGDHSYLTKRHPVLIRSSVDSGAYNEHSLTHVKLFSMMAIHTGPQISRQGSLSLEFLISTEKILQSSALPLVSSKVMVRHKS